MSTESNQSKPLSNAEIVKAYQERAAKREARKAQTQARLKARAAVIDARRKAEEPLKTAEEKAADFVRLGKVRVRKAIKAIESIGNLSNRAIYNYRDDQAQTILVLLSKAISALESRFNKRVAAEMEVNL